MEGERGAQILGCVLCAEAEGVRTEWSETRRLVGFYLTTMRPRAAHSPLHCVVSLCVCMCVCMLCICTHACRYKSVGDVYMTCVHVKARGQPQVPSLCKTSLPQASACFCLLSRSTGSVSYHTTFKKHPGVDPKSSCLQSQYLTDLAPFLFLIKTASACRWGGQ